MKYAIIPFLLLLAYCQGCQQSKNQQSEAQQSIDTALLADGMHHWFLNHDLNYERFEVTEIDSIANNLLETQNKDGGWPKNVDWLAKINLDSAVNTFSKRYQRSAFDNRNTYPQVDYLAQAYTITGNKKYKKAAERGIEFILSKQYDNGAWRGWDADVITYNDDVMTGIMGLLLDIKQDKPYYEWLSADLRNKAGQALDEAVAVTLKCQIEVNGQKTVWCQQHDHETYEPVQGRSYELASKTAFESAHVVEFLIRINQPNEKVIKAIEGAVDWFERSKLSGIKVGMAPIDASRYDNFDGDSVRIAVSDSSARPIWARFYEINTNKPFFCNRNGVKTYIYEEVHPERRMGYDWYGYWPETVLEEKYPAWKARMTEEKE